MNLWLENAVLHFYHSNFSIIKNSILIVKFPIIKLHSYLDDPDDNC